MKVPVVRLFVLVTVLFALLVGFTSRWSFFEAEELRDNPANRRPLLEEAKVHRGPIRARDGTVLARSVRGAGELYRRIYPLGGSFSQPIGYSFTELGRTGLERTYNDFLVGRNGGLGSLLGQLSGRRERGDELITTLDVAAQRVALQALAGRKGAVVALEPSTGRVLVAASSPTFDPDGLPGRGLRGLDLLNRVTQSSYPPGSTFKVVTAAAALDSGRYTPQSVVDGDSGKRISGVPLANFNDKDFGPVDLTRALTFSVNTVWAEVGSKLGKGVMARYMKKFGFYAEPPLDYPESQLVASGEYAGGRLLNPDSRRIDVGRMAIGQDRLQVTPLQMAMVAATVANRGVLMKPRLAERALDTDGRVVKRFSPKAVGRVMSSTTATQLAEMMTNVVKEGTGTAAALSGTSVAGKTGTAEVLSGRANQPWFIGFAPSGRPRVAVAVTVERSIGGQGGTVAAPIAKQVLEALL